MNFRSRLALCWRILRVKPANLLAHANRELPHIGTDPMGLQMADNLRELVLVFGTQGHSGFSAGYARQALDKLLKFEPLAPITGAPEEWVEVYSGGHQNSRCSRLFKDRERFDGAPYDIEAVVFRETDGTCFTGRGSAQVITFPYTPRTVYVDVDADGNPLDGWDREGPCPAFLAAV